MASKLSHVDEHGRARMVDVGEKPDTNRTAVACGSIRMEPATLKLITSGRVHKGDVLTVAKVAAIQAAKRAWDLIPMCHPIPLTAIEVTIEPDKALPGLRITAQVRSSGKTGVEMEALTAVSVGLLTVYDMAKAADKGMEIGQVCLLEKRGGKSGRWTRSSARR
ncbi:MAG TPA: cyclic pyranopterin monophosphate synthase MoaC [Candidatus Bipolaricaulota bacterium]